MKRNKDEKINNVDTIQYKIDKTLENFRETEEMINKSDDEAMKNSLEAKNDRRISTLKNIKKEIKQESVAKRNEFK